MFENPVVQQATIAFNFIKSFIQDSSALASSILKIRRNEIELRSGVIITCRPCSYVTIRGNRVICAICDEIAFWRHEETYANPEQEILHAIRPSMATLSNTKLVKISTPYRKEGILWRDFQERGGLDHLVWQVSTKEMNPAVRKTFLDKERQRDPESFRREYLGQFTDHVTGWITPELLDACIMPGVTELPRSSNGAYAAAIDPGFKHSDFGFAVLHRSDDGSITVVYVARWTGTKNSPVDSGVVCQHINEVLQRYGLNTLMGDQFCFPVLRQMFANFGIIYREFTFNVCARTSLYGNLKQLMVQQRIRFLDEPELLRELRRLEEVKASNGNIDIRPPRSTKDDTAIAVALAAFELSQLPEAPLPIVIGTAEFLLDRGLRDQEWHFGVAPVCYKYPGCWTTKTCVCAPWADS